MFLHVSVQQKKHFDPAKETFQHYRNILSNKETFCVFKETLWLRKRNIAAQYRNILVAIETFCSYRNILYNKRNT